MVEKQSPNDEQAVSGGSCCSDETCCPPQAPLRNNSPKIGRNESCPCGSERKFKKCCGLNA